VVVDREAVEVAVAAAVGVEFRPFYKRFFTHHLWSE
jgi:hypothetical protein